MTFDPTLTLARASGAIIMLEHHIRQCRSAEDYETAKELYGKIEGLVAHARWAMKGLKQFPLQKKGK